MPFRTRPGKHGLYDPAFEKDSCGIGFVAHLKGERSHRVVTDANRVLVNMTHRGAVGSEKNTGDGAGILTALPWEFLERVAELDLGVKLPPRGLYAAGLVFLPRENESRFKCKYEFVRLTVQLGLDHLGWRNVPRDNSIIGPSAQASEPQIEMVFVGAGKKTSRDDFERKLYILRKWLTSRIRGSYRDRFHDFYVCSLSTKVIVYKGMLTPDQVMAYYRDLREEDYQSHLAMIHSRFSTNTFPSWDRAQPLRFMSHNGEINTIRGNINKMRSREGVLSSRVLGEELARTFPVVEPDLSDSGNFDNVLELLFMAGRSLPRAVMMMIPEAWENDRSMDDEKRAFYEFNSCLMEPWDGPASIAFTDGHSIGAVLDRNGLRPSRYTITTDDFVVMASETGVLDLPPEKVRVKGRLQPGKMFLVDFVQGRVIEDEEIKASLTKGSPYRKWLSDNVVELTENDKKSKEGNAAADPGGRGIDPEARTKAILERLRMFGYSWEHLQTILRPMSDDGQEPIGSMGNDSPLACLSGQPRLVYEYFKQLFAQVTNPPIDSIREEAMMSLMCFIGPEGNLLDPGPENAKRLRLDTPFLTEGRFEALRALSDKGWKIATLDMSYPAAEGPAGLRHCLERLCREAEAAVDTGASFVVLSDRAAGPERVPAGALLSCGAVHQHLIRKTKRTRIGLVLETGEAREVHHFCMLVGYGADAAYPWLAFEALRKLFEDGWYAAACTEGQIVDNYLHALEKGMRKVFGKMGISTLASYKGAQIFEAVGLGSEVVDFCFDGTPSRIEGVGFETLAAEQLKRHALAYPAGNPPAGFDYLQPGDYSWRAEAEEHMWSPEAIAKLQIAVRSGDRAAYESFAATADQRTKAQATLRGLLEFKEAPAGPVTLDEVEPVENILKRFATGAMSFGSISREAHETLAVAMNRLGGKSNTGEGGEDPSRFATLPNGDSKRSAIKQVASGRFGVSIHYLSNADEIQIKMAQGAKPGEGGELPGTKVFEEIARTRNSTPGVGLISPPPHHDIYSIEDLSQLIFDLKNCNPEARISVKLVSEVGVGTIAAGVAKGHADHILISGHDGGTGASPLTGIKNAGLPWELGLAETHQTLVLNDLRSRVVLQTDGQLKTGRDVVIAALLGAEEFGMATAALVSLGCVMMRKCHKNTCPVGIATHDPRLKAKFTGKPEHVEAYFRFVADDVRAILARLGFRSLDEAVGRVDRLAVDGEVLNEKARFLDLSPILTPALKPHPFTETHCTRKQEHGLDLILDRQLIRHARPALEERAPVSVKLSIRNTDRSTGAMLSHEIAKRFGDAGLPTGLIRVHFTGSAGQSFGAWLAHGVRFELEGDANDYVGKGLSGGRIVIRPPAAAGFVPEENVIVGNVAFYGAIRGEAFVRGLAAERFCVRNSGAQVVVEGIGDHGCEYMTGGRVVVLGPTGRNFGAGMSGGIAYVYDGDGKFASRFNPGMADIEALEPEDAETIRTLAQKHLDYTGSANARRVLENWASEIARFVRVMPRDFKKVMAERKTAQEAEAHG